MSNSRAHRLSRRSAPLALALLGMVLCSGVPAFGQAPPDTRHTLAVALGFGVGQLRETLMSAERYDGLLPGGQLLYQVARAAHHHDVWLRAHVGNLTNRYGTTLLDAQIDAGYAYSHDVLERGPWTLSLGGALNANPNLHHYGEVDSDHIYWRTRYALQAIARVEHRFEAETSLSFGLALDLAGLVSRPPAFRLYNNDLPTAGDLLSKAHEDFTFASFGSLARFAIDTDLVFGVRSWHRQALGLELVYTRFAEPAAVETLDVLATYAFLFDL